MISTDSFYTSSVVDRLDSLESKISTFSRKTENCSKVKAADIEKAKYTSADLEMKQLLLRKLTQFRNKRSLNSKWS